MRLTSLLCGLALAAGAPIAILAYAQDGGAEATKPTLVVAKKAVAKKKVAKAAKPTGPPAKELFGAVKTPAPMAARSIGFYAKGCLAGGTALPIDGPAWQAMRLSRNRNWGHPDLVALVEKLANEARQHDGWPGLLVGDLSQPRGGPMVSSHASHQVGLDADIWFMPMPDRRLTEREREDLSAPSMLAPDVVSVDPKMWTEAHARVLKRAASYASVERIFVHPAIKKALCDATGKDENRAWLHKIRAYWGHNDHFHVRIACPGGSANCEAQPPLPSDDGCGKELTNWLALVKPKPKPVTPPETVAKAPSPPKPGLTLDQLPPDCRTVLTSGPDGPVLASKPVPVTPLAATTAKKPATTTK
jgi:penicillin-insensitive murein DD-endopeptidase